MVYVKYTVFAIIVLLSKALATVFSPLITLFADKEGRLPWILRWSMTHDAPLTAWWTDGYAEDSWIKKKYSQKDYESKAWIRWYANTMWIIRNPAYNVSKALGFDQKGMVITVHREEGKKWDTGLENKSFYTAVNTKGQKAFMFQWQWYYYKQRCVEVYLGWKLFWREKDETCMLVIRFSPFRKYERKKDETADN